MTGIYCWEVAYNGLGSAGEKSLSSWSLKATLLPIQPHQQITGPRQALDQGMQEFLVEAELATFSELFEQMGLNFQYGDFADGLHRRGSCGVSVVEGGHFAKFATEQFLDGGGSIGVRCSRLFQWDKKLFRAEEHEKTFRNCCER